MRLAMPLFDGLLIHPEGEGTTFYQGLVVLFPVTDLLFGRVDLTL
jgi:hypothetical protein